MLILKKISFSLSLRQQRPSVSNQAFLSAHFIFCCVFFGCVSRSVVILLTSLKWYEIQLFFFRILQWFCLIFILSQTHSDCP